MRYYNHSINLPDTIKIEEKRVATADSARLLNELSEEAKKNLIKSINIDDNTINSASLFFQHDFDFKITCYIRFKLNGKEFTIKSQMNRFSSVNPSHEDYLKYIYQTISEKIAIELLNEFHKNGELNKLI